MHLLTTDKTLYAIVEETDNIDGDFVIDNEGNEHQIYYSEIDGVPYITEEGENFILTSQMMVDSEA